MWELLGENVSEIIALSAFVLAVYQLYLSRMSSKISVIPHITHYASTTRNDKSAIYEFRIANTGMGPAKITSWKVLLDGSDIEKSEYKSIENYLNYLRAERNSSTTVGNLSEGHMIAIGERYTVLSIQIEIDKQSEFCVLEKELNRLDLVVDYKSVYGVKYFMSTKKEAKKLLRATAKERANKTVI